MLSLFRGPITGPKFFAIIFSFFFVIIAVNIVLAYEAVQTFPGLEVDNSYVASQTFDQERAQQVALGWRVHAHVHEGSLILAITDAAGQPVQAQSVTGIFGRPTSVMNDQTPAFVWDGAVYRAPVITAPGNWNLRLEAVAKDGTPFRQRIVVLVD